MREQIRALAPSSTSVIPPMLISTPMRLAFEVDLFADEEPPIDGGTRPRSPKDQDDSGDEFEGDFWRAIKASRVEYHASQIAQEQRERGASSSQVPTMQDAPSNEPREHVDDPTVDGPTFGA